MADFLAKIRLALEGQPQVIKGLQDVQKETNKLVRTEKISTFDKSGVATGSQLRQVFKQIGDETKNATPKMNDFQKALSRVAIVAPVWFAFRLVMTSFFNLIREQSRFLVEFEDAMARIRIVGKGSAEDYKFLQGALIALGNSYGVSASEAAKAAKIFAQQGRDVNETVILTRAALIGSQILGASVEDTINDLTAAIESFGIPVSQAISIIDKWINVEKQFAVTSKDLADATKVAGASAHQLGVTLEDFLGNVTAVVEVTRKTGAEAARGLTFIYARLLTSGKPVIEQLTKIPFFLDKQGKATSELTGISRDLSDILADLAGKWESLTILEKLQISSTVASKRQMTIFNALMQNFNRSLDATVTAYTSAGKAQQAFNILIDTAAFKSKQLGAAWNAFTFAMADTSAFKGLLDLVGTALIEWTKLIDLNKGLQIQYTQNATKILAEVEARESEINSIQKLISLRDKLQKLPATEDNIQRLKLVQETIDKITKTEPKIRIALETQDKKQLDKAIQDILNQITFQKASIIVNAKFQPDITALQIEKKKLLADFGAIFSEIPNEPSVKKASERIIEIDERIVELQKQKSQEIDKQVALTRSQGMDKILQDAQDEVEISIELTEKEREQLEIEKQLAEFRLQSNDNLDAQINKQIELVKNSKFIYDAHAKTLELEKLNNDLVDARIKKREEERAKVQGLVFQFAQANAGERTRIQRLIDLIQKTPESVTAAFSNSGFDKRLILENVNLFTKEVQAALAQSIANMSGITNTGILTQPVTQAIQPIAQVTQNAQFGNINITLPEGSLANLQNTMIDKFKEKLSSDDDFKKFISDKIRLFV